MRTSKMAAEYLSEEVLDNIRNGIKKDFQFGDE